MATQRVSVRLMDANPALNPGLLSPADWAKELAKNSKEGLKRMINVTVTVPDGV